jgi:hypothetical protein
MTTLAFDTLRYARRLKEAGVPEPQAEVQAELMAEAFGFYADNLLTRDHFTEVLNARFAEQEAKIEQRFAQQDAKFEQRFAEQDAKFEQRFAQQDAKFEQRFAAWGATMESRLNRQDRTLVLHTFMLGLITVTLVVPQLQTWLG